jgi:DHA1 family multidrug resistance protein-like MFS transporter
MSADATAGSTAAVPAPLADPRRRLGLNVLLVYTFFMVAGFAMLMPLVAVHFVKNVGLGVAAVGVALALRQVMQQGLAIGGGMLADRYGVKTMMCLGVLLRAVGFSALAFAGDLPLLLLAMALSALGGALFEAPYQAAIAALTDDSDRPRYYALSNWVSGVATTLGPLIGVALLRFDFQWVCHAAAACFALNFLIVWRGLPALPAPAKPPSMLGNVAIAMRDRPFMQLVLLLMLYWCMAVQLNLSFPLLAERLSGGMDGVGIMFALSAALTVVLQVPLLRVLTPRMTPGRILVAGVLLMSASTAVLGFVGGFAGFLACIALFSIGAILTRPTQQTLIASLSSKAALGTYLGVSSISLAIGGGVGNVAGGWLVDIAAARGWPHLPWLVFASLGVLCALGLWRQVHARHAA